MKGVVFRGRRVEKARKKLSVSYLGKFHKIEPKGMNNDLERYWRFRQEGGAAVGIGTGWTGGRRNGWIGGVFIRRGS
jgi:hypothetical protein